MAQKKKQTKKAPAKKAPAKKPAAKKTKKAKAPDCVITREGTTIVFSHLPEMPDFEGLKVLPGFISAHRPFDGTGRTVLHFNSAKDAKASFEHILANGASNLDELIPNNHQYVDSDGTMAGMAASADV